MKLNINTNIKMVSLLPLLMLLTLASYFMYFSYNQYNDSIVLKKRLITNKVLKNLSINLARERGLSAAYYGGKGKIDIKILNNQRKKTNAAIKSFNEYFKNRKDNSIFIRKIFQNLSKIGSIRKSVDKYDIDFNKMFFGYYSVINALIYDEYRKIINIQLTSDMTSEVMYEINLLDKMEKTGQERGFVSYVLAKKRPFSDQEFLTWMKLFGKPNSISGTTYQLTEKNIKNRISLLLNTDSSKKLYNQILNVKIGIIEGSKKGIYSVDPLKWFGLMTKYITLLNKADKIVANDINDKINTLFANKIRPQFIIASIVLIFTILLMILGYFIDRFITRNIKDLERLFRKVGQLADIDEKIEFSTTDGIAKGYRIIEIAIDQIQQDRQMAIEASKAKSIFLANMSHEIRTPLNGIIGFTELLKNTEIAEEAKDFVDVIEKSSENLLEIINNILDLSKIESDKIEIEEIPFSPIDEFENAIEVFGAKAAEKDISLSFYMDPSLSNYLNGDPTKIKEVLINLLSNAIKFTSNGGEIDVEIKRVEDAGAFGRTKVRFLVRDNGIGISEEKLDTIFDAFSQADSTVTRKYGGTGLGLTISSKFIALMGGKLEVESKVGEGTEFYFTLEFEETPSSEYNFKDKFVGYKCALLVDESHKKAHTKYIYDYLNYFGCEIVFFNRCKEIKGLMYREDVNYVIADMDYLEDGEIEECKNANIPGIIILRSNLQSLSKNYTNEYIKPVYEPVNVTKLVKLMESQQELLPKKARENRKAMKETKSYNREKDFESKRDLNIEELDRKSVRILVAEDNEINRKLIKKTLENMGIDITLANNGQEALDAVKKRKFDLIFMDIAMPVMDGVEALHAILDYEIEAGLKHTPIVALTANALKGDRERFLKEGFDEYVIKPIKKNNIDTILNMFLKEKMQILKDNQSQKESEDIDKSKEQSDIKGENKTIKVEEQIALKTEQKPQEQTEEEDTIAKLKVPLENKSIDTDQTDKAQEPFDNFEQEVQKNIQVEIKKEEESRLDDVVLPDVIKTDSNKSEDNRNIQALIVEDNLINQKLIEKTLKRLGLDVDIANNGEEAVEKFKNKKYDIVFMDISMPVMDGIEATHEILAYEKENRLAHTPIVALTANALPGDRETFLSEGLDEYISKPLKKENIVRVLKLFLNYDAENESGSKDILQDNMENIYSDKIEQIVDEETPTILTECKNSYQKKRDILLFKNNKIESKILTNMIKKMGYDIVSVDSFDEFLYKIEEELYDMVMFDKDIDFVEISDIVNKIKILDELRETKTVIVEFVNIDDEDKSRDIDVVDEIMENMINKKSIENVIEKRLRK